MSEERQACIQSGRSGCDEKLDERVEAGTRTEVDFVADPGISTYDEVLREARRRCEVSHEDLGPGQIEVLEADES